MTGDKDATLLVSFIIPFGDVFIGKQFESMQILSSRVVAPAFHDWQMPIVDLHPWFSEDRRRITAFPKPDAHCDQAGMKRATFRLNFALRDYLGAHQ